MECDRASILDAGTMIRGALLLVLAGCLHLPPRSVGLEVSAEFWSNLGLYVETIRLEESGQYVREVRYDPLLEARDTSVAGRFTMLEPGVLALQVGSRTEVWILARARGGTVLIPLVQLASICDYWGEERVSDTLFASSSVSTPALLDLDVVCRSGSRYGG